MFKTLIYSLIIILPFSINAQDFLKNPDCVYAEGRGKTFEEADKAALAALSNTLKVNIRTYTKYCISDNNGIISKSFIENTQASSNITLKDCHIYVAENSYNEYRIFRYINKKEYVEQRKKIVNNLLKISINNDLNSFNIKLGRLYYAYKILDDDLMDLFDYKNKDLRQKIKNLAIDMQIRYVSLHEAPKLFFNVNIYDLAPCGKYVDIIKQECFDINYIYIGLNEYDLEFEYWDGKKWSKDYQKSNNYHSNILNRDKSLYFSKICRIKCTELLPRNKYTKNNDILYKNYNGIKTASLKNQLKYRVLFIGVDEYGDKFKINVPNDWYVIKEVEMATPNLIKEWLDDDINRNYISLNDAYHIWNFLYH